MRVRSASSSLEQSRPLMTIEPEVGGSSRPAMCKSDDLPEPDGPTRATTSPGIIWAVKPRKISSVSVPEPKVRVTSCSINAGTVCVWTVGVMCWSR